MTTLRLVPGGSARCPEGRMRLDWRVSGAALKDVVLDVVRVADPTRPAVAVSPTGTGQVLVAALPDAASVVLRPTTGGTFGNGVSVNVQLTLQLDGVDAAQYLLPAVDVSGTPQTTLITLTPEAGFWQLDVPADVGVRDRGADSGPAATPRTPAASDEGAGGDLHGLAQEVAYAARRRAGGARLPTARRSELHLAIDRSASLLPLVRAGSGQALLELVTGVNEVAGSTTKVALWALGGVPTPVRPGLTIGNVAGRWEREFTERAFTSGTPLSPLVAETAGSSQSRTVLILTDGPPADVAELTTALRQAREAGTKARWHVLALARSVGDPHVRLEPWRDELSALRRAIPPDLLTCSALTPSTEPGWLPRQLAEESFLDRAIDALPFWADV